VSFATSNASNTQTHNKPLQDRLSTKTSERIDVNEAQSAPEPTGSNDHISQSSAPYTCNTATSPLPESATSDKTSVYTELHHTEKAPNTN
jgi:hypothetical protein